MRILVLPTGELLHIPEFCTRFMHTARHGRTRTYICSPQDRDVTERSVVEVEVTPRKAKAA
jgi:hypothetical protein